MTSLSKEVTTHKDKTEALVAALKTHELRIAEQISTIMEGTVKEGETPVDWAQLIRQLRRLLSMTLEFLISADQEHTRELGEDMSAREERDRTLSKAYSILIYGRRTLKGLYGDEFPRQIGLEGSTPKRAVSLIRFLEDVKNRVLAREPWPDPLDAYAPRWPREDVAAALEGVRAPLSKAVNALKKDLQETKGTLTRKWGAMDRHAATYGAVASIASDLFSLAGEEDLADRIQPPSRSSSSSTSEED